VTEDIRSLSPDARALLDRERPVPALSPAVRARAMAAARAAVAAGPLPAMPARAPVAWTRWAVAAALTCAAGAAAAAIAHRHHRDDPQTAPLAAAADSPSPSIAAGPAPAAPATFEGVGATAQSETTPDDAGGRRAKGTVPREELRLLRQARAAVARDDFTAALPPIAQHAREFPTGRLSEEREALRVKALMGLGREDEARRAASGFEARFPRSVLLPAVRRMSTRAGDHR